MNGRDPVQGDKVARIERAQAQAHLELRDRSICVAHIQVNPTAPVSRKGVVWIQTYSAREGCDAFLQLAQHVSDGMAGPRKQPTDRPYPVQSPAGRNVPPQSFPAQHRRASPWLSFEQDIPLQGSTPRRIP